MTDSVHISGIDFTGKTGKVPRWATEAAMESLTKEVRNLSNALLKKSGGKEKNNRDKLNEQQKEAIRNYEELNEGMESFATRAANAGKSIDENISKRDKITSKVSNGAKTVTRGFLGVKNKASGVAGKFSKLMGPVGWVIGVFGSLGVVINKFIDYVVGTADTFMRLYNSGVTFQKGIFEMRKAAGMASMPLENFANLVMESTAVVAALGENGAVSLGMIAKQTRELTRAQGMYGMSLEQMNEHTANYLEIQRMQGLLQIQSRQELARSNAEYTKNLTLFSQALGKSREAISEETEAITTRSDVFLAFQTLPEEARKKASKAFEIVTMGIAGTMGESSREFNEMFADLVVKAHDYENDFVKALGSVNSKLANQIVNLANGIREGTVNQEQARKRYAEIIKKLGKMPEHATKTLDMFSRSGSEFGEAAKNVGSSMQAAMSVSDEMIKNIMKAKPEEMGEIPNALQQFRENIRGIFGDFNEFVAEIFMQNMDSIKRVMKLATKKSGDLAKFIQETLDIAIKLFDPKTRAETWKKIESRIGDAISSFVQKLIDTIGRALNEKFNPFAEDTEQRQARGSSADKIEQEFEKFKDIQDEEKKKEIERLKSGLKKMIEHEAFVSDITDEPAIVEALGTARTSAKRLGVNLESILQPILESDKNFAEQYKKIKETQDLGKRFARESPIAKYKSNLFGTERKNEEYLRQVGRTPEQQIRKDLGVTDPNNISGVGSRAITSRNQTENLRNTVVPARTNNQNAQRVEEMRELIGHFSRLINVNEETKDGIYHLIAKQGETAKQTKELTREARRNSNDIR